MPELVISTAILAAHAAWGFVADDVKSGLIGSWAEKGATAGLKQLATILRNGTPQQNHYILRATQAAYVAAMADIAAACAALADARNDADARAAAKALARLAHDRAFADFRPDGEHFPREETNAEIDRMFGGGIGSLAGVGSRGHHLAYDRVVVADLAAWGVALPPSLVALFEGGLSDQPPWHVRFRIAFGNAMIADKEAMTIFTVERLGEIRAAGITLIELATERFDRLDEAQARLEAKVDRLLEQADAERGVKLRQADIDPRAVIRLAQRLAADVDRPEDALAELGAAIDELLSLKADAARGTNLDDLVDAALKRIEQRASAGEFDAAAKEAERAFAEWQRREADRRQRERASGIRLAEENIRANRFRRDAEAVATWIFRRLALENDALAPGFASVTTEIKTLIGSGRDQGVNLDLAVAAALSRGLVDNSGVDTERAAAQVWQGIALSTLGERQEGTAALDEAVAAYGAAREVYTRDGLPLQWAATQNNLGAALQTLGARQEGTAALDEAVAAYRAALEVYTRDRLPLQWAMTQNNLGVALSTLGARQEGTAALDESVAAYRAALEVYTRDRLPLEWAMTQNNLGNALQTLGARQEGTAALDEAVVAYRAVLEVYTPDRLPLDWAMTQNNLGAVLRRVGDRQEETAALDEAVAAYRAALEVYTRDRLPLDWAMTQNNLGNAFSTLGVRQEGTAALDEAVAAYQAALNVYTRDRLPLDWAATQNNLGNALSRLGKRQEGTGALDKAVAAYRAALEVRTRDRLPLDWAMTQNNLGIVLMSKAHKSRSCAAAQEAVAAYEQALEIFAHPALAFNRAKAERGLAAARALVAELCP